MENASLGNGQPKRVLTVALGLLVSIGVGLHQVVVAKQPRKPSHTKPAEPAKSESHSVASVAYEQVRAINEQIEAQWRANNLKPSERCSDYEFIRRATLDIIGRIATPEEIRRFLRDPKETRRALLIQRLLDSEEYSTNWANIWTVWLLTRSNRGRYHDEMARWLEKQLLNGNDGHGKFRYDKMVTDLLTASGKSSDNGAVNYILCNMGMPIPKENVNEEGYFDFVPLTSRTTRLFLGLQTQCTQCHDHPFFPQQRRQWQFWGIDAFFRQVKGTPPTLRRRRMAAPALTLAEDKDVNRNAEIFYEDRKATVHLARPTWLFPDKDGRPITIKSNADRRKELARFITHSKYFPKAYVNRMWGHFFSRGFTNPGPVDDFGEHNPITHPMLSPELIAKLKKVSGKVPDQLAEEISSYDNPDNPHLLDYLAQEFKSYTYDPKMLITWICNSEAYQLSSIANSTNAKADAEPFFSRMALKVLMPEELFDSLMTATQATKNLTTENKNKLKDDWMNNLIVNFGDDEGNEVTFNGTVVQALMLMNGKEINDAVSNSKRGTVYEAVLDPRTGGRTVKAIMDKLYLAALNRLPTTKEMQAVNNEIRLIRSGRIKTRDGLSLWQDVFWALLNSNEFMLNH